MVDRLKQGPTLNAERVKRIHTRERRKALSLFVLWRVLMTVFCLLIGYFSLMLLFTITSRGLNNGFELSFTVGVIGTLVCGIGVYICAIKSESARITAQRYEAALPARVDPGALPDEDILVRGSDVPLSEPESLLRAAHSGPSPEDELVRPAETEETSSPTARRKRRRHAVTGVADVEVSDRYVR